MYIEEVILEGFKSYAARTVISGWDPEFNAITGLNGTGKSNILDAICFVLGIDNLRQVSSTPARRSPLLTNAFPCHRFEPPVCRTWCTSVAKPE